MQIKTGARFNDKATALAFAAIIVNGIFQKHGYEFVITSLTEGEHQKGSKHPTGEAFDARSKHLPQDKKQIILNEIKGALGADFDVLLELVGTPSEHFHCEWDRHENSDNTH